MLIEMEAIQEGALLVLLEAFESMEQKVVVLSYFPYTDFSHSEVCSLSLEGWIG